MRDSFSESLRRLRTERGLSQQQLADRLFVNRSSVANWETGRRLPDAVMIARLSACLGVDVGMLLTPIEESEHKPTVILVDDERIILSGSLPVLERVFPDAEIVGFTKPSDALVYARQTPVDLAFLDIEMGHISGLELCRELLQIHAQTNVVFLTAYPDYALDAWSTGACGFLVKPISDEQVLGQMAHLRFPVRGLVPS